MPLKVSYREEVCEMALVRWEPFRELAALQNEMGRWMNQLSGGVTPGNGQSSTWLLAVEASAKTCAGSAWRLRRR
jgi:hypothetical protein